MPLAISVSQNYFQYLFSDAFQGGAWNDLTVVIISTTLRIFILFYFKSSELAKWENECNNVCCYLNFEAHFTGRSLTPLKTSVLWKTNYAKQVPRSLFISTFWIYEDWEFRAIEPACKVFSSNILKLVLLDVIICNSDVWDWFTLGSTSRDQASVILGSFPRSRFSAIQIWGEYAWIWMNDLSMRRFPIEKYEMRLSFLHGGNSSRW